MLPWKREDDYDSAHPIQQNEFPGWCSNKEYIAYSSPSATFLGGIEQPKIQSVIGLFRRESVGTSDTLDSHEIDECDEYTAMRFEKGGSPSNKPNDKKTQARRRGSMMELGAIASTAKEKSNKGSQSLPEYWNPHRLRFTSFSYSAKEPASLSTALITSSSNSSVDLEEED
ncbi:uncharacterized protein LOC117167352 [Belonocnema kinseyi]|uniref:uncharacterized protein LOC117167352 n=1 Tax=Belonocnema kinseyi TaxID=2817044 RepID=UPI00143DD1D5|nr:uncharacterized protein LOC117167352 [Belonocnema kinseyi]XP_033208112.1 uncharacterized protein LOC117167352 [Belonocnema kinseyi]